MSVGTPGFRGTRLREARQARGVSVVSLAELAEVKPQAIYQYEGDRSSPGPAVFDRLATALRIPASFLLMPERSDEVGTVFYRSMSSATKTARLRAEHRFRWLRDITAYVAEYVELPQPDLPELGLPRDPLLISDEDVEEAAENLRRHWRMGEGPVASMVLLLENHGVVVARDLLGAETLDGLSEYVAGEGRPYVFIGTDKGTSVRWRFDAAHELGHLLMHAHLAPEDLLRPALFKRVEEQAHRFASAFLLPLGAFEDDLFGVSLDAFKAVKPKWRVSIGMMIIRARHAGLLTQESERALWINFNRRRWRKHEPFDDSLEAEEPRLLRRAFEMILDGGLQTPADVAERLALPASDIEDLAGLPSGYLSDYAPVTVLRPREDRGDEALASREPGQVVELRPRR
ncbi:MAG: helix-turn-helix domain-containing protein [Dehalococcoidia bacterium]